MRNKSGFSSGLVSFNEELRFEGLLPTFVVGVVKPGVEMTLSACYDRTVLSKLGQRLIPIARRIL